MATDNTSTNNKDTKIEEANKDTNYGSGTSNQMGSGSGVVKRLPISFTTPALSGTISKVELFMKQSNYAIETTRDVDIHEVNAHTDWVEGEVSWNSYSTGNLWGTAGGDFSATVIDTTAVSNAIGTWYSWVLMGAGATNPLTIGWSESIHLLLKMNAEAAATQFYSFRSKEYATAGDRPYLEITYSVGGGEMTLNTSYWGA